MIDYESHVDRTKYINSRTILHFVENGPIYVRNGIQSRYRLSQLSYNAEQRSQIGPPLSKNH